MKRFVSDALIIAASHAAGAASLLLVQMIMVRSLSRDAFGAFVLAQAIVLLMESVFVPRSGEIALQLIGKAWHKNYGTVKFLAMRLRREELLWNLTIYTALVVATFGLTIGLKVDFLIVVGLGLAIPLQASYGVSKAIIITSHKIREQSLFEIAIVLFTLFAVGIGVRLMELTGAVVGYVLVAGVKTVWAHVWADRLLSVSCTVDPGREEEVKALNLQRLSVVAVWRNGCQAIANQADLLLLGSTLGNETVALYKVSKTLAAIPARVVAPIWSALRPRFLVAIGQDDVQGLFRLITVPALLLLLVGVIGYPFLTLWCDKMIELLFTEAYRDAAKPMLILVAAGWILSAVTGWLNFLAIMTENKRATTFIYSINAGTILIAGLIYRQDINHMAAVVCSASLITSAAAWYWLISSSRREKTNGKGTR